MQKAAKGQLMIWHWVSSYFSLVIVFAAIGYALLLAVSLIPQHFVQENALISAEQFMENYGEPMVGGEDDQRYYWDSTDILIMEESYNLKNAPAALINPYYNSSSVDYVENFSVMLKQGLEGNVPYVRYWQGFRIIIRPLMIFFTFQDIRKLYAVVFFILFSCMTAVIAKKQSAGNAIAVAAAVSLFNPAVVSHSLQYAPCFLLMFSFSIYVVMKDIKPERLGLLFVLFGMITQYFDFYTTPVITCVVPALLLMSKETGNGHLWKTLAVCCLSWVCGYVGSWLMKLLMVSVLTPINGFADGFASLGGRLSGNDLSKPASIINAIKWAWWLSSPGRLPKIALAALSAAIITSSFAAYVRDGKKWSAPLRQTPFLAAACVPLLWIAVSSDPVIIHAHFQYRSMLPFFAGAFLFISQCHTKENGSAAAVNAENGEKQKTFVFTKDCCREAK